MYPWVVVAWVVVASPDVALVAVASVVDASVVAAFVVAVVTAVVLGVVGIAVFCHIPFSVSQGPYDVEEVASPFCLVQSFASHNLFQFVEGVVVAAV